MIVAEIMLSASEHYRAGRIDDAVRLYSSVVQQNPDHPDANFNLGFVADRRGQLDAALTHYLVASNHAPANARYRIAYVRSLLALGRVTDAIEAADVTDALGHREQPELKALKARALSLKPLVGEGGIAQVPKVFGIGRNKTGTTSLAAALTLLGYKLGAQANGEILIEDWAQRKFQRILDFCQTASAFQDVPFSLPYTYQAIDQAYPNSKFVLTVRTDAEEWFESLTRFQTKIVGKGRLPTAEDLQAFPYRYKGWLWRAHQLIYGINPDSLYSPEIYKARYLTHNQQVTDYFRHRPADLLVINLGEPDVMQRLCTFLGFSGVGLKIPYLNRSA